MRAQHAVASAVAAAIALAAAPAAPRADDAGLAMASRPFSLGDVAIQRSAGTTLRMGRFDCAGCTDPDSNFILVAWDLGVTLPLADRAALFVLQPILFRVGTGQAMSHQFHGALTVGVRHVAPVGQALTLAAATSVSLPYPGAGGEAEGTTEMAVALIADPSLYQAALGTLRLELDTRWQASALFAQAQLALATHSNEDDLLGDGRAGVGAGVQLLGRAALLAELTVQLGGGELYCDGSCDIDRWDGPGRPAVSLGGSVALGDWVLGARGLLRLGGTDSAGHDLPPSVSVSAGARF